MMLMTVMRRRLSPREPSQKASSDPRPRDMQLRHNKQPKIIEDVTVARQLILSSNGVLYCSHSLLYLHLEACFILPELRHLYLHLL